MPETKYKRLQGLARNQKSILQQLQERSARPQGKYQIPSLQSPNFAPITVSPKHQTTQFFKTHCRSLPQKNNQCLDGKEPRTNPDKETKQKKAGERTPGSWTRTVQTLINISRCKEKTQMNYSQMNESAVNPHTAFSNLNFGSDIHIWKILESKLAPNIQFRHKIESSNNNLMFFGEELFGGRKSFHKKQASTEIFTLRPKSLQRRSVKNFKNTQLEEPMFFQNELQVKSLDTIKKEYYSNPFFKVKLDLLLRQFEKNGYQMGVMKKDENKGTQTLRGQTIKSSHINKLRMMEVKQMLEKQQMKP